MAIDADMIVKVTPIILTPGGTSLEFNGLALTKNESIPLNDSIPGILQFTSPRSVAQYFGYTSDEYTYSQVYFKGYENSSRKPNLLYFGRRIDSIVAPWIRGGSSPDLEAIKALTAGTLTLALDGNSLTITPVTLSAVTSFSEAATIVQAAIRAKAENVDAPLPQFGSAIVEYDSWFKSFVITIPKPSGQTPPNLVITSIVGTVAEAFLFDEDSLPVISNGSPVETEAQTMNRLHGITGNWVSFATLWAVTNAEAIAFGKWVGEYGVRFVFLPWRMEQSAAIPSDKTDLQSVLSELEITGVFCQYYNDFQLSAFISGAIASVNYRAIQGAITYAFKKQSGLAFNVNDKDTAVALRDKGWNFYGNYATANDRFIFYYQGTSTNPEWKWLDTYVNAIWLNNELQLAAMRLLTVVPRISYADISYTHIFSTLMGPINQSAGRYGNGIIDTGVTLSELQKVEVIREAGKDITPDLYMYGFYLMVSDPPAEDRQNRLSPLIWLWYCYGGSVHRLEIVSAAVT
jgi:hypothetical protein